MHAANACHRTPGPPTLTPLSCIKTPPVFTTARKLLQRTDLSVCAAVDFCTAWRTRRFGVKSQSQQLQSSPCSGDLSSAMLVLSDLCCDVLCQRWEVVRARTCRQDRVKEDMEGRRSGSRSRSSRMTSLKRPKRLWMAGALAGSSHGSGASPTICEITCRDPRSWHELKTTRFAQSTTRSGVHKSLLLPELKQTWHAVGISSLVGQVARQHKELHRRKGIDTLGTLLGTQALRNKHNA